MELYYPTILPPTVEIPLISFKIPAGFPSPAADYRETRIDLNKELLKNPAFTYFFYADGNSMEPVIRHGALLIVDRRVEPADGCIVLASVDNEFCVKYFYSHPDGSIELRPHNPEYKSIQLADSFEGDFEIFGCVIYSVNGHIKNGSHSSNRLQ
ncbi:MAG: LexA family protein [Pyrinomonadaceae bacterium]